ncbi:ABC transporter ATP-binding protein [Halobaculum roseum]|uniref:Cobalamin import ATP-binding protein BtuD n=1 Tax=Halobaculum roseum TaxID=2175149 RepID=A0ABD5MGV0_9EURY|nr:ABC transporter ATP-binding protein [Halobaculum roseum]QZY02732.1 ABC transporter ATP-binding protein [Halobaculum roseum]
MSADDTPSADGTDAAETADADTVDAAGDSVDAGSADASATAGESPEDSPPLSIRNIALSYGDDEPVVEAERLEVPAGEITALIGPNGSGKSTLLKAMNAELSPDRGAVTFGGRDVEEFATTELARRLGLLSQEHVAPESTTVRELATHGRYPHRRFFEGMREEDYRAVDRAIERVGVEHLADRQVGGLSGGQAQLAWLAMVLAQETDALLLDEPTTFLDLHHQLRVLDAVRDLNEDHGVTVCVVLHDLGQAARFADNLIALRDGEPYEWGPPDEVVTEDLLRDVFGVEAEVGFGPNGPRVTPRRAIDE